MKSYFFIIFIIVCLWTKTFMLTSNATLTGVFTYYLDLNQDGVVDMKDIGMTARAYPSELGDPNWNPIADVNHDGIISLMDLFIVNKHFGETWS